MDESEFEGYIPTDEDIKKWDLKPRLQNNFFVVPLGIKEILNRLSQNENALQNCNEAIEQLEIVYLNSDFTMFIIDEKKFNDPWFVADNFNSINEFYKFLVYDKSNKHGRPSYAEDLEAIQLLRQGITQSQVRLKWETKLNGRDLHDIDRTWKELKRKSKLKSN
jgi:hypothetical protein